MSEFKPRIHEHRITSEGEDRTFYIREASGREVLKSMGGKREKSPEENQRETFGFVVKDKDGTPLTKEEVDALLDLRFRVMLNLQKAVLRKSGIRAAAGDLADVAQMLQDKADSATAVREYADELEAAVGRMRECADDPVRVRALAAELIEKGSEKND